MKKIFGGFKRRMGLVLVKLSLPTGITNLAIDINNIFFHWPEREHMIHPGKKNKEKTFYIIRPSGKDEGLLSLYFGVLQKVFWCNKKGFTPFVDWENYSTQYNVKNQIRGTCNAWEYYFNQPTTESLDEINASRNVILGGWHLHPVFGKKFYQESRLTMCIQNDYKFQCRQICGVQPYILEIVQKKKKELFKGKRTLGIFLRGTDYVKLRPKGHFVQPNIEQVIKKVNEYLSTYPIQQIFVVTEDAEVYQHFRMQFGSMVFCSDGNFVKEYNAKDYLSKSLKDDPYERGLNYLIRLLLLSECDDLITSLTNGSLFALLMKEGEYQNQYIFQLGTY